VKYEFIFYLHPNGVTSLQYSVLAHAFNMFTCLWKATHAISELVFVSTRDFPATSWMFSLYHNTSLREVPSSLGRDQSHKACPGNMVGVQEFPPPYQKVGFSKCVMVALPFLGEVVGDPVLCYLAHPKDFFIRVCSVITWPTSATACPCATVTLCCLSFALPPALCIRKC